MLQSMMLAEVDLVSQHACAVACAVAAESADEALALVDCGIGATALQLLRGKRNAAVRTCALEVSATFPFSFSSPASLWLFPLLPPCGCLPVASYLP
jgi:hypothetical protein